MSILKHPAIAPLAFVVRRYDVRIILSITILSRIFLIAVYLAWSGPSLSEVDLATAMALP
ncbi:hypothetical protein GWG65_27515 [Bradyrhizobium sp. CSA207]|uniref:hypothetical protein n=1 Tax=Bradyrhizobium sp. CSA207 TaxID=2698826 RepID=UPI0023AEABC5|nr:hypothetical protein [Bradyrhizobium sp. CSA207]MDE5445126.1 hypothetical protein [Bradyrhizobium sp. CSA207]